MVSMSDIAELLGISCATVSRALNDSPKISEETKRRVLEAAKKTGYLEKFEAKRQQTVKKIGFIISKHYFGTNEPFYTKVLLGAEELANKENMRVNLFTINEQDTVDWLLMDLKEFKIDEVIVAAAISSKTIKRLITAGLKIVLVDFEHGQLPTVEPDNLNGAYAAVRHLQSRGREKIAFISGEKDHPSMLQRYRGYRLAIEEAGGQYNEDLILQTSGYCTVEEGYQQGLRLLRKGDFDAVLAGNDAMAVGVIRAFTEKGLQIPRDVSVVGFDDVEMGLYTSPPLTTVRIHKEKMGQIAASMLVHWQLDWGKIGWRVLVPTELVVRESS